MKSSKTFNNISDKLKAKIPKLQPNQSVVFQMLNGVPNPEPDEQERSKDPVLYPKVQLFTQFRIFDEYQKDDNGNEVGGYVDVGCVDAWAGDNPARFRSFVAGVVQGAQTPSRFQGKFELKGGNVRDEELYEIFYLSPQREGSLCPDSSVEVIFKIVDTKADTKLSLNKYDRLKKSLDLAENITEEKAAQIMAALNQPVYQDKGVLLSKVKDLSRTNPDVFIETYESNETPIRSVIKEALDAGVIAHDFATGEVKIGGVKLIDFKTSSVADFVPEFAKWISTAENGSEVLKNIQNRITKKAKV